MSKRSRPLAGITQRALLLAAVAVAAGVATPSRGHEGHAPLPSKGVEVDGERGMLVVSTAAARALQIEVADAELGTLDGRTLAYARLVAPWNRHAFVATGIGGRVSEVFAKPGESVRRGQRLA
jgi:multidrug efflux pump subunit AcrA (membrane-fusion protein)